MITFGGWSFAVVEPFVSVDKTFKGIAFIFRYKKSAHKGAFLFDESYL